MKVMRYILSDAGGHRRFLPLTFTRAVADLFMGMQSFRERWESALGTECYIETEAYLQPRYGTTEPGEVLVIDPLFIPDELLLRELQGLKSGQVLKSPTGCRIAYRAEELLEATAVDEMESVESQSNALRIDHRWDLFARNAEVLKFDFDRLTNGRESQPLDSSNQVVGAGEIFLEEGATVLASILNATAGPIYVGQNATIMEGCVVRGGLALMHGATLKMGSKIYGACSFDRGSKIGGEVNNSITHAYSNKGHEGFLGNSVLGSWCNLGADTNTSNLKNNYAPVRLWDYDTASFAKTGLQFCGLIMGDHSKCGINTMFNTGTVVGVSANIFGSGFPRNYVPSFSWGGASGYQEYRPGKAFETARAMMARRSIQLDETEEAILNHVFEITAQYRNF